MQLYIYACRHIHLGVCMLHSTKPCMYTYAAYKDASSSCVSEICCRSRRNMHRAPHLPSIQPYVRPSICHVPSLRRSLAPSSNSCPPSPDAFFAPGPFQPLLTSLPRCLPYSSIPLPWPVHEIALYVDERFYPERSRLPPSLSLPPTIPSSFLPLPLLLPLPRSLHSFLTPPSASHGQSIKSLWTWTSAPPFAAPL